MCTLPGVRSECDPWKLTFLDFGNKESHDVDCHLVRVETLVVGEENDGQVGIEEMCVFDHAGANVKNHAVRVKNVRVPPSGKLAVSATVQAERHPHQFPSLPGKHAVVKEGHVENSQGRCAHVHANAAVLVLGIEKVNVVPEFAVGRWQTVAVRLPLYVEAIGLGSEIHIQRHAVRDDIERVSETSGCQAQRYEDPFTQEPL